MSDMQFLPKLRDFLNKHGTIYTVRRYKYLATEICVESVGNCKRTLIQQISNKDQLSNYVTQSGFASAEHWWIAVRRFIPEGRDMWLFKVVVKV